jgi:hypothetical protein
MVFISKAHFLLEIMSPPSGFDVGVSLLMASSIIEVAQQSKARRKDDFLIAFSPIIAEATATAYKGATNEVQQKLRRVVEVWRQRQIFETPIQEAIEVRIDGMFNFTYVRGAY